MDEKNAMDLLDDFQDLPFDGTDDGDDGFSIDAPMGAGQPNTANAPENPDIQGISGNGTDAGQPNGGPNPPNGGQPTPAGGGIQPKDGFDPTGLQDLAPSAVELLDDPMIRRGGERLMDGDSMEPPFDQAFSVLTVTGGPKLQMMSRMTPPLARAVDQAFNLISNYHSRYISDHSDLYLRLNVSRDGQGRREIVESLNAGSGMSPEFYNIDQGKKSSVKQAFIDPEE